MRKKIGLICASFALCVVLSSCNNKNAAPSEMESGIVESETELIESETGLTTSETELNESEKEFTESETELTEIETELSEEDKYWLTVLEEFKDSKYDLTDALTGPALKDLAANFFMLGVGINGSTLENQTLNLPEYMAVCEKHFNSVTMTNLMKSAYILDKEGSQNNLKNGDGTPKLNFECIDPTLKWCMEHGMKMRGHTLVWHAQAPEWFFREGYEDSGDYVDKETMLFRMESYIAQLLNHVQTDYPGVIYCWDVVNEAVDPDRGDIESGFLCRTENDGVINPWYATIGDEYVEMAFTYARKYAAPEVKLFYNDFNTFQTKKRDAIYTLCEGLKEKGLIDGIGMQGYYGIDYPQLLDIEIAIKKFAKLDLELQLTELSIDMPDEDETNLEKQAMAYGNLFTMLHNVDTAGGGTANITAVTFFGLIDHYREGDKTKTRLFDKDYQLKPAFLKVRSVMESSYR